MRRAGLVGHADRVEWDQGLIDRLDLALNESRVCGLRHDAKRGEARLLVEVEGLPEVGVIDRDPRRAIVMSSVDSIEVTVRGDRAGGYGPVLPLGSLDDLEQFFAGLSWAHPMYGWEFVDVADLGPAWQVEPSLRVGPGRGVAAHSLRWFTECGSAGGAREPECYVLQGVVWFAGLRVERADGSNVPLRDFLADGARWWKAFGEGDGRLSVQGQRHAASASLRWRHWPAPGSAIVPAGEWDG
jgi:hypothetical protein